MGCYGYWYKRDYLCCDASHGYRRGRLPAIRMSISSTGQYGSVAHPGGCTYISMINFCIIMCVM